MPDVPTSDTSPETEEMLVAAYRRMSAARKIAMVCDLNHTVRELARLDVRRRHPDVDEREVDLRVASRFIEPELMLKAFGWDVAEKGY